MCRRCGISSFAKHLKVRAISGIKRLVRSFTGASGRSCSKYDRDGNKCYDKSATTSKSHTPSRASVLSNTSLRRYERHACN